jgi:hypothetical protein|tara:strand:- start:1279 stop:1848 length:570 start_codon:yes stop_codon:yes gene_type:complete
MSDIFNIFEEDAGASSAEALSGDGLKSVSILAQRIREAEKAIETAEAFLKTRKEEMQQLTDELLPAAMEELGMKSFVLEDGAKVEVRQLYGASIPVARKPEAFEWLREQGFDDIIKNSVTCIFGRGEDDKAHSFRDMATEQGFEPQQKEDVHASTLKAWVRERVEAGDDFPMDLFGAFIGQRAIIKKGN